MCSVDAPDPVVQTVKKPTFVRNDYLDALSEDQRKIGALRTGRSQLVVAKPGEVGFSGRNGLGNQGGVDVGLAEVVEQAQRQVEDAFAGPTRRFAFHLLGSVGGPRGWSPPRIAQR